jgi:hypothetical protein
MRKNLHGKKFTIILTPDLIEDLESIKNSGLNRSSAIRSAIKDFTNNLRFSGKLSEVENDTPMKKEKGEKRSKDPQ